MATLTQAPALSLADLEAFDLHPQGRDPEKVFKCPICQSDERAFHVNTQTGVYNCKRASCGATGKLTDFWTERPKLKGREYSRLTLRRAFALEESKPKSEAATAATWREYFDKAAPVAGTPGEEYLASRGIPERIASAAGVRFLSTLYDRPAVLFPFEQSGAPVAFQARYIDGKSDGHRAQGPKSEGAFLTAPDALRSAAIVLCEAPIDALSMAACGVPAVALGGTSAPDWIAKACAFRRVLLAFDNDLNGAGDMAAQKLAPLLQSRGARVARLAPLREATADKSDWNTMLLQHGAAPLRAWLMARLAHIEYFQFGGSVA
jgi:DNA primase